MWPDHGTRETCRDTTPNSLGFAAVSKWILLALVVVLARLLARLICTCQIAIADIVAELYPPKSIHHPSSIHRNLSTTPPSPPHPPIPPIPSSHHPSHHTHMDTTCAIYAPRPLSRKPPGRSPPSGTRQSGARSAASGRRYAVAAERLCSGMRQRCRSPRRCPPSMPRSG